MRQCHRYSLMHHLLNWLKVICRPRSSMHCSPTSLMRNILNLNRCCLFRSIPATQVTPITVVNSQEFQKNLILSFYYKKVIQSQESGKWTSNSNRKDAPSKYLIKTRGSFQMLTGNSAANFCRWWKSNAIRTCKRFLKPKIWQHFAIKSRLRSILTLIALSV